MADSSDSQSSSRGFDSSRRSTVTQWPWASY